jgi:hypothetical protein
VRADQRVVAGQRARQRGHCCGVWLVGVGAEVLLLFVRQAAGV